MVRYGVSVYKDAVDKFLEANPSAGTGGKNAYGDDIVVTSNAWWEDKEFQKSVGMIKDDDNSDDDDDDESEGKGVAQLEAETKA